MRLLRMSSLKKSGVLLYCFPRTKQGSGWRIRDLICKPLWRNWQTRSTQNAVGAIPCRFNSDQRHHNFNKMSAGRARLKILRGKPHGSSTLPSPITKFVPDRKTHKKLLFVDTDMTSVSYRQYLEQKGRKTGYHDAIVNIAWFAFTIAAIYLFAKFLGVDEMRERIATAGIWGPFIIILLKASTLVVAPLGGAPLYPIAGAAFGFWKGFIYTFIGDLLGTAVAFFISRIFGRKIVQYFVTKPGMKIVDIILNYLGTPRGLIHARLVFFSFPEGVTYAAGLTAMPFWKFLVLLVPIGIGPAALLVAFGHLFSLYITAHPFLVALGYLLIIAIMVGGGYWFYHKAKK
ncbi:MAG: hypothetical protein Greene071436_375 [Parcubacteria group bacterium Greene0714_36]|nr:MAG: hypothetical protein Greene071436_375 [Parcubacteria group bacterium Greene0714_36]